MTYSTYFIEEGTDIDGVSLINDSDVQDETAVIKSPKSASAKENLGYQSSRVEWKTDYILTDASSIQNLSQMYHLQSRAN